MSCIIFLFVRMQRAGSAAVTSPIDSATAALSPSAATAPSYEGRPGRATVIAAAAAATQLTSDTPSPSPSSSPASSTDFDFVCPICLQTHFSLSSMPTQSGGLSCVRCQRTFPSSPAYLDLTLTSGVRQRVYKQRSWGGTELFRNPLVSFAYERGWRQGFAWAGFPGADKEYDIAMSYLLPAAAGKVLVDMSCGSGLFSRRFARSGAFSGVVAADFSESMLQQTREYCMAEGGTLNGSTPIMLLRADVGRLPFATGSVAAVHAGAAIHCWPNPQVALAEISRVLAPGGVFVASTFLTATAPLGQVLGDDAVRPLSQLDPTTAGGIVGTPYRWWEEQELLDLCTAVGLQDWRRERTWRFIMFAVTKPNSAS
ncbi:hypothetical protein VOLCADRAFT_106536 [Volvox carteri f. nagariensis]|uniref:Methyltransferase type 11 domain-containing protein n=1 Tax=Volvox carteri f. nagariensis TaxID=3068 RepID=D8U7W0_VOLCA|nr:uncharacterized protein VOLCADRAFT_106536 [Volvox carteri f. nagariensis]EFJ44161.1 hypothetical protein VOLCADRAFT_106536 [Volvox carteri f. nagariensis]|eukprot:XP_002954755.1 hypothetical protein VOLCADRAFT_106536 [Volvox carteri f. nagariensis]